MLGTHFNHSTTRNFIVAFGDLFNNIILTREDNATKEQLRMVVPIEYAPKQKWWTAYKEDPATSKHVRTIMPRMSFEITSLNYDASRKLSTLNRQHKHMSGPNSGALSTYQSVPYQIALNLYIGVLNSAEGFQIVEQILPFFTPNFTVTINALPELGITDDVAIALNSVSKDDDYEGGFEKLRIQTWTLNFFAKLNYYGVVRDAKPILDVQSDIHIVPGADAIVPSDVGSTPRNVRVNVTPNPSNALPTDDYGFSSTVEMFDDGKIYDPITGNDIDIP